MIVRIIVSPGGGCGCRTKPEKVTQGIGSADHDSEGRVITAEFPGLYVVTAYVPNAGLQDLLSWCP